MPDQSLSPSDRQINDQSSEILTIEGVAAYLKAGKRTVYVLRVTEKGPAFRHGGVWHFRRVNRIIGIANRLDRLSEADSIGCEK